MCIGSRCLCNVFDLKGKVVYSCCVGFVNFGGRRVRSWNRLQNGEGMTQSAR